MVTSAVLESLQDSYLQSAAVRLTVIAAAPMYARIIAPYADTDWFAVPAGKSSGIYVRTGLASGSSISFTAFLSTDGKGYMTDYDPTSVMNATCKTLPASSVAVSAAANSNSAAVTVLPSSSVPRDYPLRVCIGGACQVLGLAAAPAGSPLVLTFSKLAPDMRFQVTLAENWSSKSSTYTIIEGSESPLPAVPKEVSRYDRGAGTVPSLECPSGQVQRGLECYEAPPPGNSWTTPGGLIYGKTCPTGVNDDGLACWYDRGVGAIPKLVCPAGQGLKAVDCYNDPPQGYDWTTPGGLLYGKICPAGSNDSGTTCWVSRGVGTIPDIDTTGRGAGYAWKFGDKLNENGMTSRCEKDHGKGNCQKCLAMMYPKCDAGWSASGCNLCTRKTCPADRQMEDGLCYKKPPAGYGCVAATCSYSKNVTAGKRVGAAQRQCGTGKVLDDLMCYDAPKAGYSCAATNCRDSKNVTGGNKLGTVQQQCPDGKRNEDGLCYQTPREGFTCMATMCHN